MNIYSIQRVLHLVVLLFTAFAGARRTICVKRQYTFQSTSFYQRIETQSALDCVERCIENSDVCRAVTYIEYSSKSHKTFCQFYNVNSDSKRSDIRPVKRLEPMATVFEILDTCPNNISAHSKSFVNQLSPSIRRLLNLSPPRGKNHHIQNEVTLTVDDGKSFDKSLVFGRNFAERDDASNRQTYMAKPKYPFDGQKQPIRPVSTFSGRAATVSPGDSPDYSNDLGANGGDAPVEAVETKRPVSSINSRPNTVVTNTLNSGHPQPISPVLVSHGGMPVSQHGSHGTYTTNGANPSGYNRVNCPPSPCGVPRSYALIPCPSQIRPVDPCQTPALMSVDKGPSYWSEWNPSSPCSVTCGPGVRQRKRFCSSGNTTDCPGEPTKVEPCNLPECNRWSEWTSWSKCPTITCASSQQSRVRACRNGKDCEGMPEEVRECEANCPKPQASWGPWEGWTECSKTCGGGERTRKRECLNGLGDDCIGPHLDQMFCNSQPCPSWQQWGECKYQGFPSNECPGAAQDQAPCKLELCPSWGSWGGWSACSATCGHGQQKRTRECEPKNAGCTGGNQEIRFCQLAVCPYYTAWTEWSHCSASCGKGQARRTRKCIKNENLPGAVLPSEEELTSGNIEAFKPEPEQQEDNEAPVVEEVETSTAEEPEGGNGEISDETHSKATNSGSGGKKPKISENKDAIKAQLIERSQALKNSTGKPARRLQLRESRLEVSQSASMQLADRRRAPPRSSLLALRDTASGDDNDGCFGPDSETLDCQIGPCCEWSAWSGWTYCADVCNPNGGQKVRSRTCQIQVTYAIPAPSPLTSFIQPHHDYIPNGVGFGIRVKRQYRQPGYSYTNYAAGRQLGRAGSPFQPGQPFGMPVQASQPSSLLPGSPFGTQQASCDCPGKSMELEKCTNGPNGCDQSSGTDQKDRKKGGADSDGEGSALSGSNDGESRGEKDRGYGKQRSGGIGSSVELTSDGENVEVSGFNDQQCEFGEWGDWSNCRGSCKNGTRSRTRACKRKGGHAEGTYSTFKKFIRAVEEQCQCDGDTVETESCKPKNCNSKDKNDDSPIADKGILSDEGNCYWSEWGEWSECGKGLRRRTRICVGLKALLTNCKCEGRSFEERSCSNRSSSSKKPSSAVLAVSRDILRDRLDKTDSRLEDTRLSSRQFDSPTINKDDSEENIPEEALSEETPPSDETLSAEGIKRCNYLSWQGWSGCEGACGSEGKRKRSRVCPCRSCDVEAEEETETCQTDPCLSTTNNKKYPFD